MLFRNDFVPNHARWVPLASASWSVCRFHSTGMSIINLVLMIAGPVSLLLPSATHEYDLSRMHDTARTVIYDAAVRPFPLSRRRRYANIADSRPMKAIHNVLCNRMLLNIKKAALDEHSQSSGMSISTVQFAAQSHLGHEDMELQDLHEREVAAKDVGGEP